MSAFFSSGTRAKGSLYPSLFSSKRKAVVLCTSLLFLLEVSGALDGLKFGLEGFIFVSSLFGG